MSENIVWAIIGGGHGGQTFAGHLAILGERVRLYSKSLEKVNAINLSKEIILSNAVDGIGEIEFATDDMETAITGATNIVIVLPSNWHESTAKKMIPFLQDGQNVLILPEASCGAIAFRKLMQEMNCNAKVVVGAGSTLPYATRSISPGVCNVYGLKEEVKIAALPATDNKALEEAFCRRFPWFKICQSVIETSLDNINALMHPAPVLLNTSRVEAIPVQSYQYYIEGITPSISALLEKMDAERIEIANAFGYQQRTLKQSYIDMYQCGNEDMELWEIIQNNEGYKGIMNVKSLKERYVLEDVPYSLVAMSSLGAITGIKTPCIDSVVTILRAILGEDLDEGRTVKRLGIDNMTKEEFYNWVMG
ncbi:MAG: NAD/NADP octopine/nopaline dehydrogenase family protein [Phascolarctobacterium sp.]|nr:NAD/NADP octopine/nopaline dehydrogenase family protein [Phascolarctobacterium sp.]